MHNPIITGNIWKGPARSIDPIPRSGHRQHVRPAGAPLHDPTLADNAGKDEPAKERFIYHNAGLGGYGSSNYIDAVIQRATSGAWAAAATGTFGAPIYLMQNFRGDVVYIASASGAPIEWIMYSANGVPFCVGLFDLNSDGIAADQDDYDLGLEWINNDVYDVRGDYDGSGEPLQFISLGDISLGRGVLSQVNNRIGYAGYQHAPELGGMVWHVRHRWLNSEREDWLSRDPLGYIDGMSVYAYVRSMPLVSADPMGLLCERATDGAGNRPGNPCPQPGWCTSPPTPMMEATGCFTWLFQISFPKALHWGVRYFVAYDPCMCDYCNPGWNWDYELELPYGGWLLGYSIEAEMVAGENPYNQHIVNHEYSGCCDDRFCSTFRLKVTISQTISVLSKSPLVSRNARIRKAVAHAGCRFCFECGFL